MLYHALSIFVWFLKTLNLDLIFPCGDESTAMRAWEWKDAHPELPALPNLWGRK